jgi:hypothetical protein
MDLKIIYRNNLLVAENTLQILDNLDSPFAAVLALIDRSKHVFDLCDVDSFITSVLHPDMKANLDWVVPTLGELLTLNAQFQVAQPFCDVLFYLARLMAIDHTHAVRLQCLHRLHGLS